MTRSADDAHGDGTVLECGKQEARLILMMLARFWGEGEQQVQLMLMMLARFWGLGITQNAAAAYDAGSVGAFQ